MNLCIDIGNTRTKLALFAGNELRDFRAIEDKQEEAAIRLALDLIAQYGVKNVLLSSVAQTGSPFLQSISTRLSCAIELTHETPLPIINSYHTPKTLGKDRLAAVVGANALFPNDDLLVIDAGTCIKYDFIDREKRYHGGSIAPGLAMKLNALHAFTQRLPNLELPPSQHQIPLTGFDTSSAMLSGVIWGTIAEADGFIDLYKAQYPTLKVLLTGGDAPFLETTLKNRIFARPYLVLEGLNRILNHNYSLKNF